MFFDQKQLLNRFSWLQDKNRHFMISADYDGLICAAFLHHHLNWSLTGYYDLQNLWISKDAEQNSNDLIWVDLNILPKQGKAIGGHIISWDNETPQGFETSCNPNILAGVTANSFDKKFPFSTILFLYWLNEIPLPKDFQALALLLHADASWLKIQNYSENCKNWINILNNYNWSDLNKSSMSKSFERKMDQYIYPLLLEIGAISGKSKLTGKTTGIRSKQFQFNPDWDEDILAGIMELFANVFKWSPPKLPKIKRRVDGHRKKIKLSDVKKIGLMPFIRKNKVFSYAVPAPYVFNYTTFGTMKKSPLENS